MSEIAMRPRPFGPNASKSSLDIGLWEFRAEKLRHTGVWVEKNRTTLEFIREYMDIIKWNLLDRNLCEDNIFEIGFGEVEKGQRKNYNLENAGFSGVNRL